MQAGQVIGHAAAVSIAAMLIRCPRSLSGPFPCWWWRNGCDWHMNGPSLQARACTGMCLASLHGMLTARPAKGVAFMRVERARGRQNPPSQLTAGITHPALLLHTALEGLLRAASWWKRSDQGWVLDSKHRAVTPERLHADNVKPFGFKRRSMSTEHAWLPQSLKWRD